MPEARVLMLEGTLPRYLQPLFRHYGVQGASDTAALMAGRTRNAVDDSAAAMSVAEAIAAVKSS